MADSEPPARDYPLFDASPFPAVVTRLADHVVLAINQRTSEVFGVSQADAVGRHAPDYYVDPQARRRLREQVPRTAAPTTSASNCSAPTAAGSGPRCRRGGSRSAAPTRCSRCSRTSPPSSSPSRSSRPARSGSSPRATPSPPSPPSTPSTRAASTTASAASSRCRRGPCRWRACPCGASTPTARPSAASVSIAGSRRATMPGRSCSAATPRPTSPLSSASASSPPPTPAPTRAPANSATATSPPRASAPCSTSRCARAIARSACCAPSTSAARAPGPWTSRTSSSRRPT